MNSARAAGAGIDVQGAIPCFAPENYVLHHIQRAVVHKQSVALTLGENDVVTVSGGEGVFVAHVGDMERFCARPASDFRVELTPFDSLHGGSDVAELLWMAAFHASAGRLISGCYHYDVVDLVRWPNLTRLPGAEQAIRLAALLSRHPTSILLASRLLDIDAADIYRLYSAAHCAGLVRLLNREPEIPDLRPHAKRGVLSLILQRLAGH